MGESTTRAQIQDSLYEYPYHYVPIVHSDGRIERARTLAWGYEYMAYLTHTVDQVCRLEPSCVLDIGCGDGRLVHELHRLMDCELVGVDQSERAISFARAFTPTAEFVHGDATDMMREFDVVTLIEVLEHVPDDQIDPFVSAAVERVRPGGRLLVSVPSDVLPVSRKHYRHYNLGTLLDTFARVAGEHLDPIESWHVFSPPMWLQWYERLTCNRWWYLKVPVLERWIGQALERARYGSPEDGRHVSVELHRRTTS